MNTFPFPIWICSIILLFCISCKNEPKTITSSASTNQQVDSIPSFSVKEVNQKIGNCETDDNCLEVSVTYPVLNNVKTDIQELINTSIRNQVISSMEIEEESTASLTIEGATQLWANAFKEYLSDELENDVKWFYELAGSGTIYKHFAIAALPVSTFTGGAHPNYYQYFNNYNLHTGEEITLESIIQDSLAFNEIAEKAFYKAVKEKDSEVDKSFFFWDKPFYLPANFAITKEGIHLQYNPYEAAAYVFGIIEFTIPYKDLTTIIKLPE